MSEDEAADSIAFECIDIHSFRGICNIHHDFASELGLVLGSRGLWRMLDVGIICSRRDAKVTQSLLHRDTSFDRVA
jgi:hypothetical protein